MNRLQHSAIEVGIATLQLLWLNVLLAAMHIILLVAFALMNELYGSKSPQEMSPVSLIGVLLTSPLFLRSLRHVRSAPSRYIVVTLLLTVHALVLNVWFLFVAPYGI